MDTNNQIALCLDVNDTLCDVFFTATLLVLQREGEVWKPLHRYPIDMNHPNTIPEMKASAMLLAEKLGDCTILVAKKFLGVCYQVLSGQNLYLFELEETSDGLLHKCAQEVGELVQEMGIAKTPVQTDRLGVYTMDLIALQHKHPEISSKMALKQFLKEKAFQELWLNCRHLPPWIASEPLEVRQIEKERFLILPIC